MTDQPSKPAALRVVLITGSSSGIGAALARQLAREGAALVLHGRTTERAAPLGTLEAQCREAGAAATTLVYGDLADDRVAQRLVDHARDTFGQLDQVVSNAGFARRAGVLASSSEQLVHAFAVMPVAFAALVRAATPLLARSPCPRIIAVSSFVAHRYRADALFAETAAAKAALEALVRSAALELAARHITVNAVIPGYTRKDTVPSAANAAAWTNALADTPSGLIVEPDDIAAAIRFLLSDAARHITGALLPIDGGLIIN